MKDHGETRLGGESCLRVSPVRFETGVHPVEIDIDAAGSEGSHDGITKVGWQKRAVARTEAEGVDEATDRGASRLEAGAVRVGPAKAAPGRPRERARPEEKAAADPFPSVFPFEH